jgi:Rrf2 family protein
VKISARSEYAIRSLLDLARAEGSGEPRKADSIARAQGIPIKFLENILVDLKKSGLVRSQRGADGGYWLNLPADAIDIARVIRAVDGPLASVRGERPESTDYENLGEHLPRLWIALRASIRNVLERVTLADVLSGEFPAEVEALVGVEEAWLPH